MRAIERLASGCTPALAPTDRCAHQCRALQRSSRVTEQRGMRKTRRSAGNRQAMHADTNAARSQSRSSSVDGVGKASLRSRKLHVAGPYASSSKFLQQRREERGSHCLRTESIAGFENNFVNEIQSVEYDPCNAEMGNVIGPARDTRQRYISFRQ